MNNTALGAENKKEQTINFISEAHEKFYYEKLKEVRYQDVYHKALCYCLGISDDTRRNVDSIYDFKTGCVKTECLHEGWQTSGSMKVVRMAFNLYCNGTPSVDDYAKTEEQVTSAGSIQWRTCSAVPMHLSFGRRYRSAIRSMRLITGNCMPYLEELTNVKSQIDGNEE